MAAVNRGGGMTRKKVVKVAAMGIVLGIGLGIVLSILALNLFIRLGDYSWLQHLLRFEATKECADQGNNNKVVEAIRQRGAPGVRLLLEQGEDAQQEINCFGDTLLYPAIFQIQWGEPRPDRFEILTGADRGEGARCGQPLSRCSEHSRSGSCASPERENDALAAENRKMKRNQKDIRSRVRDRGTMQWSKPW